MPVSYIEEARCLKVKQTSTRRTCCNAETEVKIRVDKTKCNKPSSNADFNIRVKIHSNCYFTNADYSIISGLRNTLLNV